MVRSALIGTIIVVSSSQVLARETAVAPASQPAIEVLTRILTAEQQRDADRKVIDAFVAHVQRSEAFDPAARNAVADAWQKHRDDEDIQPILVTGLAILYPAYNAAMEALDAGDYETADAAAQPLLTSKDPYLSLHAPALLARSLVEQDQLEEAQKLLEPLAARQKELAERSFLGPRTLFLLGYSQLANLQYDDARATLERFDREYPNAPDQYRLPARQMLQELKVRRPESLGEVSDLMVYAGRGLGLGRADLAVQTRQERAVELLTQLIEEAEEQERQQQQQQQQGRGCKECEGKGCPKCQQGTPQGNNPPNSPANQSVIPPGQGRIGHLNPAARVRPGEQWGRMRPEDREQVLQALRQNFPSRYRQLVEQYYKQLAKER